MATKLKEVYRYRIVDPKKISNIPEDFMRPPSFIDVDFYYGVVICFVRLPEKTMEKWGLEFDDSES